MEAPPQFPGAPKKNKTLMIVGGIALALVLCCCGVCGFGYIFGKDTFKAVVQNSVGMVGCSVTIDQQRDALLTYAEKHGGVLPPAKVWQDSIKPYVKRDAELDDPNQPIQVPSVTDDFCDPSANTAVTYNADLSGKKLASIKDQMGTVALFESTGRGRNKSASWKEPSFQASPKIFSSAPRGWIRQGLRGEVTIKDQSGNVKPVPRVNDGKKIQIDSGDSK